MKKINIDESSGFCWGVVQTIEKVEEVLKNNSDKQVYVLGEIIHNPNEIKRLSRKNLITINHNQLDELDKNNSIVVIRAHGEPPETYQKINNLEIELVDATCPLVKKLQEKVLKYYNENWQIVIFGKHNHSEVIGLRGVCNDECIVIKNIDEALAKIDFTRKTMLCSQTTMDVNRLKEIKQQIENRFKQSENLDKSADNFDKNSDNSEKNIDNFFTFQNTVCNFVINREQKLKDFAGQNDLILFVAGHNSSNGKVLFEICKAANPNTIFIENFSEIDIEKLKNVDGLAINNLGITGATSTPKWLLEEIKAEIETYLK
jgi:4-hydroxy-3-methylbut-2-enyl diphosphate reductase